MIRPQILMGLDEIARYCRRHRQTIWRWSTVENFPLCILPDGIYATSSTLIDAWMHVRKKEVRLRRLQGYRKRSQNKAMADAARKVCGTEAIQRKIP